MEHSFKWKKQKLLWDFGIRSYEEFNQNVHIFRTNKVNKVIKFITNQEYVFRKAEFSMIVIIVPIEHRYKLNNIIIREYRDLEVLKNKFKEDLSNGEVWVCINNDTKDDCYSGRYCIDTLYGEERHIIEIIKGNYPRLIEKIKVGDDDYFMLERKHWGTSFKKVYYGKADGVNKQIRCILQSIERKRENIENFQEFLQDHDINSISLEFKMRGGKLTFIDWDSDNDKGVISYY